MCTPTRIAITGSSHSQPVAHTSANPTTTPTEVYTSAIRWVPSARSATERWRLPTLISTCPTTPLNTALTMDSARPRPSESSGRGFSSRSTAR